jgi:hypothetical protein
VQVSQSAVGVDFKKDVTVKEKIAEGGAAIIYRATIKNQKIRQRMNVEAEEEVVVKVLKGLFHPCLI